MLVPQLLLETLEDLGRTDFHTFKFYLGQKIMEGCEKIAMSHLENSERHNTVRTMIQTYGEEMAVDMTVVILRIMKHNDAAEKLKKKHTEGGAAQEKVSRPHVTHSSALGRPADHKISADGADGAIATRAPVAKNGSMLIAGNIGGNVGGNGRVIISGNVGGNVGGIVGGNDRIIVGGSIVGGNVGSNVGGNISSIVRGRNVGGSIVGGNVDGNVEGNIRTVVGGTIVGGSIIGGNVGGYVGGNVETIIDSCVVRGSVVGGNVAIGSNYGNIFGGVGNHRYNK